MKTQDKISLVADQELDAVVGGRMIIGPGPHVAPKLPPGSIHAGNAFTTDVAVGSVLTVVAYVALVAIFG